MELTGLIKSINQDYDTGQLSVTISIEGGQSVAKQLVKLIRQKVSVRISKFRKKRSLDANGLLWHCLGKIAEALHTDKWEVYLQMLKRYGKFTYICVKPNMVEAMKKQWRECEVVGEIDINGKEAVQLLCYFGSSTYDTKEFSVLLDGVISEMAEMGIEQPTSKEMERALEQWEKMYEKTV